jgi:hypothetical protein
VFLHDFRLRADNARVKTTRQSKADNSIKDTFYWPDMTVSRSTRFSRLFKLSHILIMRVQRRDICRFLDAQGLPDANQRYVIPESFASLMSSFHNRGIYSIYNHFAEFCVHNNRLDEEHRPIEHDNFFQISSYLGNRHVFGTYRLKMFVHLSTVVETTPNVSKLDFSFASGITTTSGGSAAESSLARSFAFDVLPSPTVLPRATASQVLASAGVPLLGGNPQPSIAPRSVGILAAPPDAMQPLRTPIAAPLAAYRGLSTMHSASLFAASPSLSPIRPVSQRGLQMQPTPVQFPESDDWILRELSSKLTPALADGDAHLELLVLANTLANYTLSGSMSPGAAQDANNSLVSPKGRSVIWADSRKAKLERWEGDSVEEAEHDSTSSLSAGSRGAEDDYFFTMDPLELESPSGRVNILGVPLEDGEPLEASEWEVSYSGELRRSSTVWDRLPELQQYTAREILGESAFAPASCVEALGEPPADAPIQQLTGFADLASTLVTTTTPNVLDLLCADPQYLTLSGAAASVVPNLPGTAVTTGGFFWSTGEAEWHLVIDRNGAGQDCIKSVPDNNSSSYVVCMVRMCVRPEGAIGQ